MNILNIIGNQNTIISPNNEEEQQIIEKYFTFESISSYTKIKYHFDIAKSQFLQIQKDLANKLHLFFLINENFELENIIDSILEGYIRKIMHQACKKKIIKLNENSDRKQNYYVKPFNLSVFDWNIAIHEISQIEKILGTPIPKDQKFFRLVVYIDDTYKITKEIFSSVNIIQHSGTKEYHPYVFTQIQNKIIRHFEIFNTTEDAEKDEKRQRLILENQKKIKKSIST